LLRVVQFYVQLINVLRFLRIVTDKVN